jgi:hypothetical protein
MIKSKRSKKIGFALFNSVYTQRVFSRRYKLLRIIFVVEDIEGNFRIEEHPSLLGYFSFTAFALVAILPAFIYSGIGGLLDLKGEIGNLIKRKPLRYDDLYHNIDSTKELIGKIGWLN